MITEVREMGSYVWDGELVSAEVVGLHKPPPKKGVMQLITAVWKGEFKRCKNIDCSDADLLTVWCVQFMFLDTRDEENPFTPEDIETPPVYQWHYIPDNAFALSELAVKANEAPYGEYDWILRYLLPIRRTGNDLVIPRFPRSLLFEFEVFMYDDYRVVASTNNLLKHGEVLTAAMRYMLECARKQYKGPDILD